jgi:hypothetical protein
MAIAKRPGYAAVARADDDRRVLVSAARVMDQFGHFDFTGGI